MYWTDHKQTLKYHLFPIFRPKNISLLQGRRNEKMRQIIREKDEGKVAKARERDNGNKETKRQRERLSRKSA